MEKSGNTELAEIKSFLNVTWSYWPLFILVNVFFAILSFVFIKLSVPKYTISSSILINDKTRGSGDARIVDAINPFQNKKLVENEIEILKSKDIIEKVVDELNLSVGIFFDSKPLPTRIYDIPLKINYKNLNPLLRADGKQERNYFFQIKDSQNATVNINGATYSLNDWIELKDVSIQFIPLEKNLNFKQGYYFSIFNRDEVIESLQGDLDVEPTNKLSTVIRLQLKHPNPELGEEILKKVIEIYYQRASQNKMEIAQSTIDFIEKRMDSVSQEISKLNFQIERLRNEEGLIDIGEQGRIYLNDIVAFDRQKSGLTTQLAILDQVEGYLNDPSGQIPSSAGVNDPNLNILLEKLSDSEIEYERLKKTTGTNNPILKSVKQEIDNLKPSILQNIQSQKKNLRAALGNVNYNIGKFSGSLKTIPTKERQLLELSREKEVKTNLFNYLQDQKEETTLANIPDFYEANIVEHPGHSMYPTSPKKFIVYLIGIFLALVFFIVYVVRKEFLNNKILYRKDIENHTSLPVMAEIPFIKIAKTSRIRSQDRLLLDNSFRNLGIHLGLYRNTEKGKTIMVTSSIPGEGKSFISENLARTLSTLGKKVVLIDTDFIKPKISINHRLQDDLGLLEFFQGKDGLHKIIYPVYGNENLKIVPAGIYFKNYAGVLDAQKFEFFLEFLKQENDFIIIDSAPVNVITDFGFFAPHVDHTLFAVRHNFTPEVILGSLDKTNILDKLVNPNIVFNYVRSNSKLQKGANYGYQYLKSNKYSIKV